MFWSKTKDAVHDYVKRNQECFVTMENTLLGSVLDGLTWCGKEGSNGKAENRMTTQSRSSSGLLLAPGTQSLDALACSLDVFKRDLFLLRIGATGCLSRNYGCRVQPFAPGNVAPACQI